MTKKPRKKKEIVPNCSHCINRIMCGNPHKGGNWKCGAKIAATCPAYGRGNVRKLD